MLVVCVNVVREATDRREVSVCKMKMKVDDIWWRVIQRVGINKYAFSSEPNSRWEVVFFSLCLSLSQSSVECEGSYWPRSLLTENLPS